MTLRCPLPGTSASTSQTLIVKARLHAASSVNLGDHSLRAGIENPLRIFEDLTQNPSVMIALFWGFAQQNPGRRGFRPICGPRNESDPADVAREEPEHILTGVCPPTGSSHLTPVDEGDHVMIFGVDTHKRSHTIVATDAVGKKLATKTVSTTTSAHLGLLCWAREQSPNDRLWAIEDCRQ